MPLRHLAHCDVWRISLPHDGVPLGGRVFTAAFRAGDDLDPAHLLISLWSPEGDSYRTSLANRAKPHNTPEAGRLHPGGDPFRYDPKKTPYADAIGDACDHPEVRVILVKGNTRSSKTTKAESMLLRDWSYGPVRNVLWVMQDENALVRYIDERGEKMLRLHDRVNERVNWGDRRSSRFIKQILNSTVFYLPATLGSLRGISAPIFVADEIDAYNKRVRDAIMTLITSRQEEYGNDSKAYICSHPDAGPDGGIDLALKDSLLHLWHVQCPHCGGVSSPAAEVEEQGGHRLTWNVPEMMALADEMDRVVFLDHVRDNVVLACPHDGCHATFGPDERLDLMSGGKWLQPHQTWTANEGVQGEPLVAATMGFVIHAFMAPFVKLRETARDWAAAKLTADASGNEIHLREVTVKKLGETYQGTKPEEQMEKWRVVQSRIQNPAYSLKTVPAGVVFLTAFVDVQGDRFEVVVIGWDLNKQSWLVDRYPIKQWPKFGKHSAFDTIDPGNRLADWDVIEEAVVTASYPLASNPQRREAGLEELFLPIARTVVNSAGQPGVTNNARVWLSNMLSRKPGEGRIIPSYRVRLMQGSAKKEDESIYGKTKPVDRDDKGRALPTSVFESYPIVNQIKRIIALRMKIADPGPGRMNVPAVISPRVYHELTAERLVNGDWIAGSRRNETWDGWVACEFARASLHPDRPELWNGPVLPEWADPRPRGSGIETMVSAPVSVFDRLAALNDDG